MKKTLFVIISIGILAVLVYTLVFLYKKSQEKTVSYKTEKPFYTDIIQKTVATGSIVPRKEIFIKPVVSGVIDQIVIEAGQLIKEGDVIARIRVIPNMVSLNDAENRLRRAQIQRDNAKLDFDRNKILFDQGVISRANFQPIEITQRNAEAELDAAEDNLKIIREGVSLKKNSAANTLVRSTISGMVLDVPVEIGNSVIELNNFNEGTTVASVADMTDLIFEGKVDESEVGKLKEGMDLILTIGAIEGQEFAATLEFIAPKGVEENGAIQFEIKAAVNLSEGQLIRAGYSANANVVLARRDSVLAINEKLVQFEGEANPYVEVAAGPNSYEKRPVTLGLSDGLIVEVLSGLQGNEAIKIWNQPITDEK